MEGPPSRDHHKIARPPSKGQRCDGHNGSSGTFKQTSKQVRPVAGRSRSSRASKIRQSSSGSCVTWPARTRPACGRRAGHRLHSKGFNFTELPLNCENQLPAARCPGAARRRSCRDRQMVGPPRSIEAELAAEGQNLAMWRQWWSSGELTRLWILLEFGGRAFIVPILANRLDFV